MKSQTKCVRCQTTSGIGLIATISNRAGALIPVMELFGCCELPGKETYGIGAALVSVIDCGSI